MLISLFLFIYLFGSLSFSLKRKHLLLILLRLEFIIISLYYGLVIYLYIHTYEIFFLIVFLTLRVCESALGLSILVSLMRSFGNDYFRTFRVL